MYMCEAVLCIMDYRVVKVVDLLFVQCIEIFRIVVIIEFVFVLFFRCELSFI